MLIRATGEVRAFLELASSFILMGVVLVWLVSHIPAQGQDAGRYAG
jgi:ferrous iron transport protein B